MKIIFVSLTSALWCCLGALAQNSSDSDMEFRISLSKEALVLPVGTSTAYDPVQITCKNITGDPSPVAFKVSGAPTGVRWELTPGGGYPIFQSTLIFYATPTVQPGQYTIRLIARGGIQDQEATLKLDVRPTKRAFITSTAYTGDFGGVAAGDSICQRLAKTNNRGGQWKVWLADSDPSSAPDQRLKASSLPYSMFSGQFIALNWKDLTDQNLIAPLNIDETGAPVAQNVRVWTNVGGDGSKRTGQAHCYNWTSVSGTGNTGAPEKTWSEQWTNDGPFGCTSMNRLYCMEE